LKGQLKWKKDYDKLWKMFDNSKTNGEKMKIKLKIKKHVQNGREFWHPKTFYKIDKKDIEKLKKSNCIFARKIDKNTDISLIMKNV
jgi:hypothetical protein